MHAEVLAEFRAIVTTRNRFSMGTREIFFGGLTRTVVSYKFVEVNMTTFY